MVAKDARLPSAELFDTGDESTKWPTNVNDEQIYPDKPFRVAVPDKLTDIVLVVLKHKFITFAARRIAKFRR